MEGVSQEAASIAGHLGLGRLVYVYDDNHITIDGTTALTFTTEDKGKRFEALRLARASTSTTPRTSTRSRRRSRAAQAEERAPVADRRAQPHRLPGARTRSTPRRRTARRSARTRCARRRRRSAAIPTRTSTFPTRCASTWPSWPSAAPTPSASGTSGFAALGGGVPRSSRGAGTPTCSGEPRAGLARRAAVFQAGRGRRHARRGQEGDAGASAVHADDDRRRGRPRRVDEDRVRGRAASSRRRTPAATSRSASASTRWARS